MSSITEGSLCAGGRGQGRARGWVKNQGLTCVQKAQLRKHWNKQSQEGGEFGSSSFLFSQPGQVPNPRLNLVRSLALCPMKELPGGSK
jgi:hypothetical protein